MSETQSAITIYGGWDGTLATEYLFQGVSLSDGNPVLQPTFFVGVDDFSAALWFNYDLRTEQPDEFDFYLQHDWHVRNFAVGTGYAYFRYPHRGWDPSQEFYLDVSVEAPLNPSLSVHYDFDAGKGSYSTLGIAHDVANEWNVPVTLGAELFYQSNYYEVTGIPAAQFTLGTAGEFGKIAIAPSVSYVATWENGDFTGDAVVPSKWLLSVNFAQGF